MNARSAHEVRLSSAGVKQHRRRANLRQFDLDGGVAETGNSCRELSRSMISRGVPVGTPDAEPGAGVIAGNCLRDGSEDWATHRRA